MSAKRKSQAALKRKSQKQLWIICCVVSAAVVGGFLGWKLGAPPVPEITTTGFDPIIASAIAEARKATTRAPRSAEARGQLGMVLLAHDVRAEASVCFAQASAFAPRDPRWPYFRGLAQLIDNAASAVTNLDRAVKLFGDAESAPRLKFAAALLDLGRLDEAEAHYKHVWQKENSNSAPAALGLGKIANARGQTAEAIHFLTLAKYEPTTRKAAHRLLVSANQRLERTNEVGQLARALEDLPNDEPLPDPIFAQVEKLKTGERIWLDTGDDWIKAGRIADAEKLLEKAVQTYPQSPRALFLLGRARQRQGNIAGAEQVLVRAVEIAPDTVEAQMQLGVLRMRNGRARQAEPCFRAAIHAQPNLGEAWYNLGLCLSGNMTKRGECIAAFREAIKFKPDLIEAYLGLAVALRLDGQQEAAAAELRRALELQPGEALRQKLLDQLKLVQPQ